MADGDIRYMMNDIPTRDVIQDRKDYLNEPGEGLLSGINTFTDDVIHKLVFEGYSELLHTYSFAIRGILLMFILAWVIAAYRGLIRATVEEMISGLIKFILISGSIFYYGEILSLMYSVLIYWPDEIAATLLHVVTGKSADAAATQTYTAIDTFFSQGFKLGEMVFSEGSITSPIAWLWGILIFIATFALGVIPLGMTLMAKIAVGILLSFTIIFFIFFLFNKTTGFVEGWIRTLVTMVFVKLIAFSIMAFSLLMLKKPFAKVITNQAENSFHTPDVLAVLVVAFIIAMLYRQTGALASSIGSGFALQAGRVSDKHKEKAQKAVSSGISYLARQVGRLRGG